MKSIKVLSAAAIIAVAGSAATAGGLAPEIMEAPVVMVDTPAPAGSISPGLIVLGLVGALVAASGSF